MKGLTRLARSARCAAHPIALLSLITAVAVVSVLFLNIATYAVSIHDGDSVKTVYTLSSEPEDILSASGVTVSDADEYTYSGLGSDSGEIKLLRAFPVSIDANGNTYYIETTGGTVRDVLAHAGVSLSENDEINFALDAQIIPGMAIAVTSVNYKTEVKEVELPFDTKVVYSDSLYEGETTYTEGKTGIKLVTYSYKLADGRLIDTKITDETVSVSATPAVKTVGTKKKQSAVGTYTTCGAEYISSLAPDADFEVDENGIPTNYSKKISGTASAYSAGSVTSTGKKPRTGYVAVDPKKIPYGTKMYIRCQDGSYIYGYAVAQDTGGFVKKTDRIVDLYFNSKSECIRFGLRDVDIYIL